MKNLTENREVVRCIFCNLNQFATKSNVCRRCGQTLGSRVLAREVGVLPVEVIIPSEDREAHYLQIRRKDKIALLRRINGHNKWIEKLQERIRGLERRIQDSIQLRNAAQKELENYK